MDRWTSVSLRLLVLLCSVVLINCEWIKIPLRTRDPEFTSLDREPSEEMMISDKMDSFVVPFRVSKFDHNHTKQMDIDLDKPAVTNTRRVDRVEDKPKKNLPQVTKKRIAEPFSIFGFLRSIRDSFFFKAQPSVKEKVGFLQRIRDNILTEIKRRILNLFPAQRKRRITKRDLDSHEHGHDFVSADGALVTICFLTFSVFLIKLVLQIIYIFKAKHYSMATSGEAGTVGAVRLIRKNIKLARSLSAEEEREEDMEKYLKVMEAINHSKF